MIGIGTKVVCIKTPIGRGRLFGGALSFPNGIPVKGEVYVVSHVGIDRNDGALLLRLIGKPVYRMSDGLEIAHWAGWFAELEHEQMRAELEYYRKESQKQPLTGTEGRA